MDGREAERQRQLDALARAEGQRALTVFLEPADFERVRGEARRRGLPIGVVGRHALEHLLRHLREQSHSP